MFVRPSRVCNAFLWDQNIDNKWFYWTSWDNLRFPLEEEGLGFHSFEDTCQAFSWKLWCRLCLNNSVWSAFMHQKYIKTVHPSLVRVHRPSAAWRRLDEIYLFVEDTIRWCLGKGIVDFWHDCWLLSAPITEEVAVQNPPHMLVVEFYTLGGWIISKLQQWLPAHLVQYVYQLSLYPDLDDMMVWLPSAAGCFSIKLA